MIVQQCLHGYKDGHRLIATSANVSKESEKELAILSDLSGNAGGQEFPPYLTGYPLQADNLYAFARTWPATEMRRPGCVWTHTLLIGLNDLPIGQTLSKLMSYFRRPFGPNGPKDYSEQIEIRSSTSDAAFCPGNELELELGPVGSWLHSAIQAFYAESKPIMLLGDMSLIEPTLLSLWTQGWSTLQYNLSFCTLAISPRSAKRRSFELQASTHQMLRKSSWSNAKTILIDTVRPRDASPAGYQTWSMLVANDVCHPNAGGYRDFLRTFGEEFVDERNAVPRLSRVFEILALEDASSQSSIVDRVREEFPLSSDAVKLKRWLFGFRAEPTAFRSPSASYFSLLKQLLSSEHINAFDQAAVTVREGLTANWQRLSGAQRAQLLAEVTLANVSPVVDAILEGVAAAISERELAWLPSGAPQVLARLVSLRPELMASAQIWQHPLFVTEWLESNAETMRALDKETARRIVHASLTADAGYAAPIFGSLWGPPVAVSCLRFVDAESCRESREPAREWKAVVGKYATEVIDEISAWPEVSSAAVALVACAIGASGKQIAARTWTSILDRLRADDNELTPAVKSALLEVALQDSGEAASRLLEYGFEDVHTSLVRSELSLDAWNRLRKYLPPLTIWDSWDTAERLRRGVSAWYVRNQRPLEEVFALTDDEVCMRRLLRAIRLQLEGRHYLADQLKHFDSYDEETARWKLDLAKEVARWGI